MKDSYQDGYFERFTTEQLEEMIDLGLDLSAHENREALLQILEVLEERESPVDVEEAWQEFQTYYNIPEGKGVELYETGMLEKKKKKPTLRLMGRMAVVAAAAVGLFITGAMLSGQNVIGIDGRWTDETFRFVVTGSPIESRAPEQNEHHAEFQGKLRTIGIKDEFAPFWWPEGFEPGEVECSGVEDVFDSVRCNYYNEAEDRVFYVDVELCYTLDWIDMGIYEKDAGPVEEYVNESNGRKFYIMSNCGYYTAVWSDGRIIETIAGGIKKDEIKQVINSIP